MEKNIIKIKQKTEVYNLLQKLKQTDYVTDKLVTALVDYVLTSDKSKLLSLYVEYKSLLDVREECRKKINDLESKINE